MVCMAKRIKGIFFEMNSLYLSFFNFHFLKITSKLLDHYYDTVIGVYSKHVKRKKEIDLKELCFLGKVEVMKRTKRK